jgi:hypothetical protein
VTPIALAAWNKRPILVKALLQAGANPDGACGENGASPEDDIDDNPPEDGFRFRWTQPIPLFGVTGVIADEFIISRSRGSAQILRILSNARQV